MKRHSLAPLLIVVLLSLMLAACAAPAAPSAAPATQPPAQAVATEAPKPTDAPAASAEPVELRITWWGSQARNDLTNQVIELFQQKYPNIKINAEFAAWNDYWTKVTTQAAGGNLPDIMQQDYAFITDWSNKKLIVPLDPFVADGSINLKDVNAESLAGGKVGEALYGINLGNNSQAIVVDVDAFQKAGVELPKPDWTWADFEKTAMTLTEKLGYPGMSWGLSNDQWFKNVYITVGSSWYGEDGASLGNTDDGPLVDFLNMYLRLQQAGAAVPRKEEVGQTLTPENDPITKGKAAMAYTNSNQIVAMAKAAGEGRNLMLVPLPRTDKPTNYFKPSMFWSITANSEHPKEAAMFIDFFTNSLEANKILNAERGVPVSTVVRDALAGDLAPTQAKMFEYIASLDGNVSPIPRPDPTGHSDIVNNVWHPVVIDPVMYEQTTPEEAVAKFRTQATEILAKNKQ